MTGYIGKATNRDRDVIGSQARQSTEDQWGEMVGEVVSFDPKTQTAKIKPLYKKRLGGEPKQIPDLEEVPVRFQRQGGFVITTPVKPGNKVTLRPQMRNSEDYHVKGDYTAPDSRAASLSDYEAFLDGGESLQQPISNFNNTNMELRSEDGKYKFEMSEDGQFRLQGKEDNWFALLREIAELLASDTLVINYGSSAGSGHQLEHKDDYAVIRDKLKGMEL